MDEYVDIYVYFTGCADVAMHGGVWGPEGLLGYTSPLRFVLQLVLDFSFWGGDVIELVRRNGFFRITGLYLPHLPPGGLPVPGQLFLLVMGLLVLLLCGGRAGAEVAVMGAQFVSGYVLRRCNV